MDKKKNRSATEPEKGEFVISRVFDAPRELVFKAQSESERLERWWWAKGFTTRVIKLDFRPGGVFHYSMRTPDDHEMWGKFVYREIVAPEWTRSITTKGLTLSEKSSSARSDGSANHRPAASSLISRSGTKALIKSAGASSLVFWTIGKQIRRFRQ
jgi:Activator of Hsp90 ATPase homolog 1-like protein